MMLRVVALASIVAVVAQSHVLLPGRLFSYTDAEARNIMLPLSAAAFSDNAQPCLTAACQGLEAKEITVSCEAFSTCSAFIGVCPSSQAIVISFRGSDSFAQFLEEGWEGLFSNMTPATAGGQAEGYFNSGYQSIWDSGLKTAFLSLKAKYNYPNLWVTGHSLGGSMASLCASAIVATGQWPSSQVTLITFGQPRTGDADYANAVDRLVPNAWRVTHSHDMVPHLPPDNFKGYQHHGNEIWYDNDMTSASYVECDENEGKKCSDSNLADLSIEDHLHYFNKDVSGYGENGCH